jgi:hypothetical protein
MSRRVCWIATVFVLACLMAGTAQAWPPVHVRPALAAPEAEGVLDAAWSWLASLFWPGEPSPVRRTGSTPSQQLKYGCGMDPNGRPLPCSN